MGVLVHLVRHGLAALPTRVEKSAYFECGMVRFVPVTGGCLRISAGTLVVNPVFSFLSFTPRFVPRTGEVPRGEIML